MVSSVVYGWLVSLLSAVLNELAELAVTVSSLRVRRFHQSLSSLLSLVPLSHTVLTKNEL